MKAKMRLTLLVGGLLPLLVGCTIFDFGLSTSLTSSSSDTSLYSSVNQGYSVRGTAFKTRDVGESIVANYLPSTGSQKVLVIPVILSDYSQNATPGVHSRIVSAFSGNASATDWESVASFYEKSSYGKLHISFTVTDWYPLGLTTSQIAAKNSSSSSAEGVQYVLDHALSWYRSQSHSSLTEFDQDKDGYLDGVWLIYSAPDYSVDSSLDTTFWAFTTWASEDANVTTPTPNTYCWASYDFMDEGYAKGVSLLPDAHTFIHESGHMLGLEDYYSGNDTQFNAPMGCLDMMDYNISDHDAYSKFALGWIEPYILDHAGVLTLPPFESSGEAALIPTGQGWNGSAFDEYVMLEYYTPTGLNAKDATNRYSGTYPLGFSSSGVRVFHVDSRLIQLTLAGNSSNSYGPYLDTVANTYNTGTLLANSNTYGDGYLDAKYPPLIQTMDYFKKRNFARRVDSTSSTFDAAAMAYYIAGNDSLFPSGSSFSMAAYKDSFPYGSSSRMDDGSALLFQVAFSNETSAGVTLTVKAA